MKNFAFLIFLLISMPACASQKLIDDEPENLITDFAESTHIIRMLMQSDSLDAIIENSNPELLELLINNFSPAQIALESEVLNCTQPVLIYFYADTIEHGQLLYDLAHTYRDTVKVMILDIEKFPKIAEDALIEQYPAIIIVNNRQQIYRDEMVSDKDDLRMILDAFQNQEDCDELY